MKTVKTFSKTLLTVLKEKPIHGKLEGDCCMCGTHTKYGNKKKFGANFTCADYLYNGDVICPYCQYLVKNSNSFRRTMFLLTEHEFTKFKKQDLKDIIFNLPVGEDFYLYLTQTWQKLGYVLMNKARNTSNTSSVTVVMDYDIIIFNPVTLEVYYDLIVKLRELKISKEVLTSAHFEVHHLRRMVEHFGHAEAKGIIEKVERYKTNPVWELAVYISD